MENNAQTENKLSIALFDCIDFNPWVYMKPFLESKGGYTSFLSESNNNISSWNCI